jgi:hypothetical protein
VDIFLGVETVENSKTDLPIGKSVEARRIIWRFLNVQLRAQDDPPPYELAGSGTVFRLGA